VESLKMHSICSYMNSIDITKIIDINIKNMTKIINKLNIVKTFALIVAVGFFAVGTPLFSANVLFNTLSADCSTVRVRNVTQGTPQNGVGPSGCDSLSQWTNGSISANPGDVIAVAVYYHNTGSQTATDTRVKVTSSQNMSASTSHSISVSVAAGNGGYSAGFVTVNLSESQTLEYIPNNSDSDSTVWYDNGNGGPYNISSNLDQNLFNSTGVRANGDGIVEPTWSDQGTVRLRFVVGDESEAPSNPDVVTGNTSSVDLSDVTLHGTINNYNLSSMVWFNLYDNNLNLIDFTSQSAVNAGSATQSFDHEISGPFVEGQEYSYQACGFYFGIGGSEDCGSYETFTIGNNNSTYACSDNIDNDGDNLTDYPNDPGCSSPTDDNEYNSISYQDPVAETDNEENLDDDSAELNGSVDMNSFYNGIAFFVYGQNYGDVSDVEYDYNEYSDANNNEVNDQFEVVLVDNNHSGNSNFSYNASNLESNETYYFLMCVEFENENGNNELECGSTKNFHTDDENYSDDLEVDTFTAQNVDTNSAELRGDVDEIGSESVYRYFEWGTNTSMNEELYISGSTGSTGEFSRVLHGLNEDTTYYYQACAEEIYGGDYDCGVRRSFRTDSDNDGETDLSVVTTDASSIGRSTAVLNGIAISSELDIDEMWFEWGSTVNLGRVTSHTNIDASGTRSLARSISGLSTNTIYYFRAVAEDSDGNIERGLRKTFRTDRSTIIIDPEPPIIINQVDGAGSLFLALDIEPDFENVIVGDTIDYTVKYRNIADADLEDVVVQVIFAEKTQFVKSTAGFYSLADHKLTVIVGDLDEDEKGEFVVRVEVLRGANGDLIVAQANAGHEHPSIIDAQVGTVPAYALNHVVNDPNRLVGLALFGGAFFPTTFLGWLILLLVIIALVLLARKLYTDHEEKKNLHINIK
jgi:uncharacterized repeat protein (TIGR01451 family)